MEKSQDSFLIAKLTIPYDATPNFIDQLRNLGEISHSNKFDILNAFNGRSDAPPWWNPAEERVFTSAHVIAKEPNHDSTNVLISSDGRKSHVVYICWMNP